MAIEIEYLKLSVPALIAVLGWFIAHQFNAYRDRVNKKRELRIQYLLEAYRRLESVINRPTQTEEQKLRYESAMADIQLLGTPEQANLAARCMTEQAEKGTANIDDLLNLLRKDLRAEIRLAGEIGKIVMLRFDRQP